MQFALIALLALTTTAPSNDWPQFRGPAFGVADGAPPIEWNLAEGKNLAWQAELPGRGPSSPIVVGERVFVTASGGPKQDQLYVLCFDFHTGQKLWQRQFWATGRTACHPISAVAAPTPASDGKRIFAYYSSNDLICLDLDGNLQWCRGLTYDYPLAGNDAGMGSSVAVADGVVVVLCENQGDSFALGVDAATGENKWRLEREPIANWCTPVAVKRDGDEPLLLLQSASGLSAHAAATGEERWKVAASCDLIPSPVLDPERIYFVGLDALHALERTARGEQPARLWSNPRLRPGAASPVVARDRIFIVNRAGVLNCADAATGEVKWQLRLKGEFWATPAIVNDKMFLLSQDGNVQVVRLGDERGELVAQNEIGEKLQASPAIAGNSIVLRSDQHLWRFSSAP